MKELRRFTISLAAVFGLPWLFLVMIPWAKMRDLRPIAYGEADGEVEAPSYPPGKSGQVQWGHRLYAQEGCVYCHTQMVRPTYAGSDLWRLGWGGREEEGLARETRPHDFLGEPYAFLGVHRIGPDLSNAGWRLPEKAWHHLHLFNPRIVTPESVMPSFNHLYKVKPIEGGRSAEALDLQGPHAPPDGYQVVPTPEARALVDYILSLKKDHKLPTALESRPAAGSAVAAGDSGT